MAPSAAFYVPAVALAGADPARWMDSGAPVGGGVPGPFAVGWPGRHSTGNQPVRVLSVACQ